MKDCTSDGHKTSRGLSATAELLGFSLAYTYVGYIFRSGLIKTFNPTRGGRITDPAECLQFHKNWLLSDCIHWYTGGLLHLVQRAGDWAGPQPAQAPPRCTKCNNPPINGQCTNFLLFDVAL